MTRDELEAAFWRILGKAGARQVRALVATAQQAVKDELAALTDGSAPAGMLSLRERETLRRRVVLYEEGRPS